MDLLHYFNEINELKEEKNNKQLELLLTKIKNELQDLIKVKQNKIIDFEQKRDYKIKKKKEKLTKNKQILVNTIQEYSIKENTYKFPEELIRINEFHNELVKNRNQLQEKSNLVNQKIIILEENMIKYNSLLIKNKKLLKFYEKYLFHFEKKIDIFILEIENNFANRHIYDSLFFELCSHRIKILQKNLNIDLEILGKKFNGDILENQKYITELKLNESKYQNNSELENLKLENIKLNIDLALQNEKFLHKIYSNKKQKLLDQHKDESNLINIFIHQWQDKIKLNKIRLSLEKHLLIKYLKYLEKEVIFFTIQVKDNKNCIYNNKLQIENYNNTEFNIHKKLENKIILIQEVILEKNKIIKETTKKYKYYMNYYTYFIKDIKVSNLVLSRDIKRLKKLNIEENYCSNENKKISIYNKLIKSIENVTITKD